MTGDLENHANPHIQRVAVLQRKPSRDDALSLLKEIAKRVSYLMKENKFRVGMLVEFCPRDKRLLGMNVNRGTKILLRLRNPNDEFRFLPMESIMGTMLHELTHNLHGPHDNRFYAKLDDLLARQWVIEQQGLFDTFLGQGSRLGGSTRLPPLQQQLQKRPTRSRGRKLGGSRAPRGTPREMAALAAQRRAQDSRSCGDASSYQHEQEDVIIIDEGRNGENKLELEPKPKLEVIDLT
ncbi:hypothetical protein ZYGR_0Z02240 [Zygosaccharomyces rouxii]|uniref:ZYRO0G05456p n=2 Tax=Zygosaccharomyces rouxii TaxID=4956 RepID=C5DZL7_ZYGRC|nr:uncharacterized protein ZYRO0G05456g [Zygosaccharomyces rouxii]KAH9202299.1 WLM domain-containing protein [Zygosaccharomyces rouxii]GAV50801.1 hypothetical protein ZYGR_0Z02240 [Zygosaccharomyces rouxii]CAR29301.1 ZYRO0G05456p [Zygosaccharomyces rouxii]